ncbi:MAG: hypothetical protein JWN10_38 [Solirubrobacterales bacterium]|nr:hypothetical protein [Solirubrobacterales bacterium]
MSEPGDALLSKLTEAPVELLETTLRDGSYAVDFQFDEKFVAELLGRLDKTPIRKIELGHGLGFEAERSGAATCNIDLRQWCEIARSELANASWGMFAQPAFSRLDTLAELCAQGMSFVRIGMEPEHVAENVGYLGRATQICQRVYLNLMKTGATPAERLPGLLSGVPADIAGVYIVDSYGSMLPDDVRRYVTIMSEHYKVLGFHGHDNLGMATANTVAAIEAGAKIVDGTLNGVGRGAGNAQIESLAGILSFAGEDRYDYQELSRLAEFCRVRLNLVPDDRNMQVLGGVIGIHSALFPLIESLCAELDTDAASLMKTAADLAHASVGSGDIRAAAERIVCGRDQPAAGLQGALGRNG